ncbi:MAG: hypothetical protein ACOC1O_00510 [bacterium]
MNILKILKTNNKEFEGTFEQSGSHYYVFFKCEKCGKEAKKQKRRIELNGFICSDCLQKNKKHSKETKAKIGKSSKENNNISLMRKSLLKKYGKENPSQIKQIKITASDTKKNNLLPSIIKKINEEGYETNLKNYIGQRVNNKNIKYKFIHKDCGTEFEGTLNGHIPKCPVCFPKSSSVAEKEIKDFILSLNIKVIENDRAILNGKEIDIYLPDYKLAIEYDGLYWHSEKRGKDKYYHLEKTKEAKEKGIDLIHIFEDEWRDKKEIVKSIIKNKLNKTIKIFARKCFIKEINLEEEKKFLKENHIQGYIASSLKYGLYYENELISIMTFGKSRFNKNFRWELLRFCNKLNYSIIGGASKLFKYFLRNTKENIISYSDKRYFDGKIYSILGFNKQKDSYPNYYYLDSNYSYRFSRIEFQKHKLKNKLNEFDENLTEYENMLNNGYDRIWDCGNSKWILER